MNLPITFVGSQWESGLSGEPYVSLPPDQNPNVVTTDGAIVKAVCPFGPLAPWREIGRKHTDNPWMKQLQQWYPNPPLVIFLSNNEHSKLRWTEVEKSKRYLDQYGPGRDADFKRKVVADGWIERYRVLAGRPARRAGECGLEEELHLTSATTLSARRTLAAGEAGSTIRCTARGEWTPAP